MQKFARQQLEVGGLRILKRFILNRGEKTQASGAILALENKHGAASDFIYLVYDKKKVVIFNLAAARRSKFRND